MVFKNACGLHGGSSVARTPAMAHRQLGFHMAGAYNSQSNGSGRRSKVRERRVGGKRKKRKRREREKTRCMVERERRFENKWEASNRFARERKKIRWGIPRGTLRLAQNGFDLSTNLNSAPIPNFILFLTH